MTPSVGKKLSLFVALVVLATTSAIGTVSYHLMEKNLANGLRKDTLDASGLLASRVRSELRHVAEKCRLLAAAALEEFKNPEDQMHFLEENLALDDQLLAMSLFRRSSASNGKWVPVFRLTRPEEDPAFLTDTEFKNLDLKYPLDFAAVGNGAVDVSVGKLENETPILRLAVPIARKAGGQISQILTVEIRQERVTAAFGEATAHFSFLLDRHGRLLTQTDPTHFTLGEDLSHLPILQMSQATEAPNGSLDYQELPGGLLQYGSFQKVGYADLVVVSQASRSHILYALRNFTRQAVFIALGCVFLAMAVTLLASWGIVGSRLARVGKTFKRIRDGRFNVNFPERSSEDEIGSFARTLQEVCDELEQRQKVHGTFAKLKGRRVRSKLEEGKIKFQGERLKAMVMNCHLHGIDKVITQADPELLINALNEFNRSVAQAIEKSSGIVDHIHGGSIVAYWGIPIPDKRDADRALSCCLTIRDFAKTLNQTLNKNKLPEIFLAIGVHYGSVVAGQVGSEDRLEYTAFGEALEVANRIQSFTDQFGTDILVTGPALSQAPQWFSVEKVAPEDDGNPDLYELLGKATQNAQAAKDEDEEVPTAPVAETESEPQLTPVPSADDEEDAEPKAA